MKTEELIGNAYRWAKVRGIHDQSDGAKQVKKFFEERQEYVDAETDEERMDAIGDMAVCLINADYFNPSEVWKCPIFNKTLGCVVDLVDIKEYMQAIEVLRAFAKDQGFVWEWCLAKAWNEIKDRQGMMVDGTYVKWEDLDSDQKIELTARIESQIMEDC